jgi:methyltransferase
MHPNLRTAGTLPSLDMPHHLRANEYCPYREGVTTTSSKAGTNVDVGLPEQYLMKDVQIPAKTRVTAKLGDDGTATPVSPGAPREEQGYYWGYTPRQAGSLSAVFTECTFDGGYDLCIGTSERGEDLEKVLSSLNTNPTKSRKEIPHYTHLLITFGGPTGLETAWRNDPDLAGKGKVRDLCDLYVNVLPGQGSRTIRTEEAVWIGLMGLQRVITSRKAG